jgi:outer membrane receptor protein involved in Fe transport
VASEQTGFGYFKNFGKTRRQGLESGINGRAGRFTMGGVYTFLHASFRSVEQVNGVGNSSNHSAEGGIPGVEGAIAIGPGNRIPLIPQQMGKAYLDLQLTKKLALNLGVVAVSSSIARGNENNRHQADGVYYLGPGESPGYGLANLGSHYQMLRHLQLWVQISNLFNQRYYSAAQLGPTGFTAAGNFIARPFDPIQGQYPVQQATFYAPGAPRGVWGGARFQF